MFIEINGIFYNINTIKRYRLRDGNLYLYFTDSSDAIIYEVADEIKKILKKLEYDSK